MLLISKNFLVRKNTRTFHYFPPYLWILVSPATFFHSHVCMHAHVTIHISHMVFSQRSCVCVFSISLKQKHSLSKFDTTFVLNTAGGIKEKRFVAHLTFMGCCNQNQLSGSAHITRKQTKKMNRGKSTNPFLYSITIYL